MATAETTPACVRIQRAQGLESGRCAHGRLCRPDRQSPNAPPVAGLTPRIEPIARPGEVRIQSTWRPSRGPAARGAWTASCIREAVGPAQQSASSPDERRSAARLYTTDACRQFRTQETDVGSLVRHTPNRGEPKVDRGRRIPALFEVNPVPEHHGAVESEARLRAVPGDELTNRVVVGPLAAGGCQTVQHRRLGLFEVRERQDALRRLPIPMVVRFGVRDDFDPDF